MHNYGSAPTIELLNIDDLKDLEQNNIKLVDDENKIMLNNFILLKSK